MDEKSKNDIMTKELVIENRVLIENMQKRNKYIEDLKNENQNLNEKNKALQESLDLIMNSRSYKLIRKIKKIIKRR